MLNVLAGRIPADLEVTKSKTGKDVCSTSVYVWPGDKQESILVKVEAWGEQAHELAKYKKGDTIQFVGEAKTMQYKPKGLDREVPAMGYVIRKIDHDKTILKEVNELLGSYIKADKEKQKGQEEQLSTSKSAELPKQPSSADLYGMHRS